MLEFCLGLGEVETPAMGFCGCTLNRVVHLRTDVHQTHFSEREQMYEVMQWKMLKRTMKTLIKYTEMLWESVKNKYKNLWIAEGLVREGSEEILEHRDNAVDFLEVGGIYEEDRTVSVEVADLSESYTLNVYEDENNVGKVKKAVMMEIKLPTNQVTSSQDHLGVNLAVGSAGKHPGQGEETLWVKHSTMVDQWRIISRVQEGMVEDLGIGAKLAKHFVTKMLFSQCLLDTVEARKVAEVITNMGVVVMTVRDSKDEQKTKVMKDFSPCSAHKLHKKRPGGVPRSIHCCNRRNTCWAMLDRQWPLNCSETSSTCGAVPAGRHSEI